MLFARVKGVPVDVGSAGRQAAKQPSSQEAECADHCRLVKRQRHKALFKDDAPVLDKIRFGTQALIEHLGMRATDAMVVATMEDYAKCRGTRGRLNRGYDRRHRVLRNSCRIISLNNRGLNEEADTQL